MPRVVLDTFLKHVVFNFGGFSSRNHIELCPDYKYFRKALQHVEYRAQWDFSLLLYAVGSVGGKFRDCKNGFLGFISDT